MPEERVPETSEDIFKAIQEAEVGESEEATEEISEETEGTEEEVEETSEEEETETTEEKVEEEEPERFPIKVKGKVEFVTRDKLVEYAQKGRFLEEERAKDKEEQKPQYDKEAADKEFLNDVKQYGVKAAVGKTIVEAQQFLKNQEVENRREARALADSSDWGKDRAYRERFFSLIDEGESATNASLAISSDYWQEKAKSGEERGAKKQKKKEAANLPKGKPRICRREKRKALI